MRTHLRKKPVLTHRVEADDEHVGYTLSVVPSGEDSYQVRLHEDGAYSISLEGDQSLEEAKELFCRAVIYEDVEDLVHRAFVIGFDEWAGIDEADYKAEEGK